MAGESTGGGSASCPGRRGGRSKGPGRRAAARRAGCRRGGGGWQGRALEEVQPPAQAAEEVGRRGRAAHLERDGIVAARDSGGGADQEREQKEAGHFH